MGIEMWHTIGRGEYMRDYGKVGTVCAVHEEGHTCDETNHCCMVVRVEQSDTNTHTTHRNTKKEEPEFLRDDGTFGCAVNDVYGLSANVASYQERGYEPAIIPPVGRKTTLRSPNMAAHCPDFVCPRWGKFLE